MIPLVDRAQEAKVALERARELEQRLSDLESAYPVDAGTIDRLWDELATARDWAMESSMELAKSVLASKGLGGVR